jgi:hypothetical protein
LGTDSHPRVQGLGTDSHPRYKAWERILILGYKAWERIPIPPRNIASLIFVGGKGFF